MALAFAALQSAQAQPSYTVSPEQLQQVVAQRFPRQYAVSGLLNIAVQAPQLRLLPAQNRISAEMAVQANGPALQRSQPGTFDVDFALRYEASDHTLRAYQLKFQNLRFANLQPQVRVWLNAYGPALATQSLQEVVLHQLSPQDLAMADKLGMQPDSITVTDKGLVIGLVLKPL
ncbi:putative transmembrane protein [Rhodoferax antarcticus ANT.BR]|uniref:Putative transmembrane protein n=1 Tax=Rhodoferax antarcticus ANT.BR TaxID=1111071 RepID=A0A1Q8YHU2_9BURK|nr:putative transmembrane protein [Rhodoferax antarcticus ANT.BR]